MQVTEITSVDEEEYREKIEIKIDGDTKFRVHDGEQEDNNLGRNFSDCHNVTSLLIQAHEAGKRGEELSIEFLEEEW